MKKLFSLSIFLILFLTRAYSQINVIVTDANTHEAIAGAMISNAVNDAKLGTTNANGRYTIAQQNISQIKVSMVGYTTQTVNVNGVKADVTLTPSTLDLQPVVVTASREGQARQDAPIAISKINSTQIKDTKATAIYQLLNKVTGVYAVDLGNEQHTMAIRQPITYNALYLYMEDGLPIRPTGDLQPQLFV